MVKRLFLAILLTLLFSSAASALTLDDVMYMSSAGVEDSIIIAKIEASGVIFDLSTSEIVDLWEAGVSPNVIEYMINTAAGAPRTDEYDESEYDDGSGEDEVVVVHHPRTRVYLYLGFGYYDNWYYPYWWWTSPYYYDPYYFSFGFYWPYYYYWNPYAYYWPWDYWDYGYYGGGFLARGIRHHWRRGDPYGSRYAGRSGYRLKPKYSRTGGGRGGYLARDGRYVFPKNYSRGRYLRTHEGYRKPLASSRGVGRGYGGKTYRDRGIYKGKIGRSGYSKDTRARPRRGAVTRGGSAKDGRSRGSRVKTYRSGREGRAGTVKRFRGGSRGKSGRGSVHSSRPRSGGTRGSIRGSRSSGSRGSFGRSSGSRGGRGGRRK